MENVVLIIHLLLALSLIGAVLMQRSEGGGLGMGSGGGGGAMSSRSAATAMGKVTWILGIGLLITTMTLTIIAADKSAGTSVVDRLGLETPAATETAPGLPATEDLLAPPADAEDAPLVPRAD